MRLGVRLQLLVLLFAAMLVGLVPLFFATSTYTRVALERLQQDGAARVGGSVASQISIERARKNPAGLVDEMNAQIEGGAVQAIAVYDLEGQAVARVGDPKLVDLLPDRRPKGEVRLVHKVETETGPTTMVFVPGRRGGVITIAHFDPAATRARELAGLVGIYIIIAALTVLVVAYFGLTRWIIRPVVSLERAADHVAGGSTHLAPLERGPTELIRLSHSLSRMTERLHDEEEQLRQKIDEVEQATDDLKNAQASLVRSERLASVGRLAAGLAHEVGNPLSALMGMQDLLLEGGLSQEEHDDFLRRMKKETTRIHRVLSDLLAFARPAADRAQRGQLHEAGEVSEAIADLVALLSPQKDFKELELTTRVEGVLHPVPLGHQELTQVLLNLIINAADAVEHRGHIDVTAACVDDCVTISVTDDGPGIAPEVADTLFEPFVSTKEVGRGTGLGLAVSRGLVDAAGGSIILDQTYEGGARFIIELPVAKPT